MKKIGVICGCLRSAVGCKPREAVLYPDSVVVDDLFTEASFMNTHHTAHVPPEGNSTTVVNNTLEPAALSHSYCHTVFCDCVD